MMTDIQLIEQKHMGSNQRLAKQVLEELISKGVKEFCLCPGARNAPLIYPLAQSTQLKIYHWPEERSAAFFALGRIKATGLPVAVVTTSGSAVAEILPAAMEAYYTSLPLVILTADRPRRFRGTGAPQAVEQVGIFSYYAPTHDDLADEERCDLKEWQGQAPLHLNVCFEEPRDLDCQSIHLENELISFFKKPLVLSNQADSYLWFLKKTRFPLVIVSALNFKDYEAVIRLLLHLNFPVYLESISGIREEACLTDLSITYHENLWQLAAQYDYPIDGILRIGGIPTSRLWRDLEENKIAVCSISENPFSGLTEASVIHTSLAPFVEWALKINPPAISSFNKWKIANDKAQNQLQILFEEEPQAEPSLIHALSLKIPERSKVYLGNSLPIREWDQAATYQARHFQMACSRGVNGIDGQFSTFLGFSCKSQENWAILGDLTLLYDLVAPWITAQLEQMKLRLVVVNNGGAQIFQRMFAHPAFQNQHELNFEFFAKFWRWHYEKWEKIPADFLLQHDHTLIELVPDNQATERFIKRLKEIE